MDITALQPGDELLLWMRTGLALTKGRAADGSAFMYVPLRAQPAKQSDIARAIAWVVRNDPRSSTLYLQVARMAPRGLGADSASCKAEVHYQALSRCQLISKICFQPTPVDTSKHPTHEYPRAPYRVCTEVRIPK